jgi:hypothetical protein
VISLQSSAFVASSLTRPSALRYADGRERGLNCVLRSLSPQEPLAFGEVFTAPETHHTQRFDRQASSPPRLAPVESLTVTGSDDGAGGYFTQPRKVRDTNSGNEFPSHDVGMNPDESSDAVRFTELRFET